ncbi:MAG: hypothetical protein ACYCZX_15770 [Rhodospirillaceae bacterium]
MAKGEFVLSIGDDNVVLTRLVDRKVANAWLGSPDPAMAQEELGEALAQDPKGRISVIIDTLDQAFKEEEIPRVGILDRRKVLARHINMAFPGANLRGARLVAETAKKVLLYEFASVPLDGRIPGWLEFVESLPNEKGGYFALAAENVDILKPLTPKDAPVEEGKNLWRHLIGINVTGGLRQIIEKNGRLCLTRLTQAPPAETPPAEFADMIQRDFKATITYIRRLGYQVGDALDLAVLTTADNKSVLEDLTWDSARSVSVYTPYEAGALLGLGSIGREDQAYCDVLHAAWFASKRRPMLPLTRSAAMGDTKDDLRELAYMAAPYVAGLAAAAVMGWAGWTGYQLHDFNGKNEQLKVQLNMLGAQLSQQREQLGGLPYDPKAMRNVLDVDAALDLGKIDIVPALQGIFQALQGDAIVRHLTFVNGADSMMDAQFKTTMGPDKAQYFVIANMNLASVITKADEAMAVARKLEARLNATFGKSYKIQMIVEPVSAQSSSGLKGDLFADSSELGPQASRSDEAFVTAFRIAKVGP